MIRFVCTCGRTLQAREENAGKVVQCPACQQRVTVPVEPAAAPAVETEEKPTPPRERIQSVAPTTRANDVGESSEESSGITTPVGNSGKAIASLVLGILSLFCNVLSGLPALIVGILALRDIGRSQEPLGGRGLAVAGIITACVGTLLSCVVFFVGLFPLMVLLPAVQKVREAASRAQSQNNLKQMGLAMHNYNAVNNSHLPAAAICDKNGRPLLSWRVAILPYIEEQALYSRFKLDEPWDGPHNIQLLALMPKVYRLPDDPKTPLDHTHYQVFVGNGAAFDLRRGFSIPGDFTDGTSNTILIAEAANAVPWTKPEDIPFDPRQPMIPLMSNHFRSGFDVVLVDGSTRVVSPALSDPTFKAAITRNGGELLGPDW
jgi:uncharacterized membrane protein YhaH (DUF805 family)/DNA-directed RNA polymerase subunit RPC12/RpoP